MIGCQGGEEEGRGHLHPPEGGAHVTVEVQVAAIATVARLAPQQLGRVVGQPQVGFASFPLALAALQGDARVHVRQLTLLAEAAVRLEAAAAHLGAKGAVPRVVGGGGAGAVEGGEGGSLGGMAGVRREEPGGEGGGVM